MSYSQPPIKIVHYDVHPAGLSRYLPAVRPPPQNSAGAKKLGGSRAARKRPIGEG